MLFRYLVVLVDLISNGTFVGLNFMLVVWIHAEIKLTASHRRETEFYQTCNRFHGACSTGRISRQTPLRTPTLADVTTFACV